MNVTLLHSNHQQVLATHHHEDGHEWLKHVSDYRAITITFIHPSAFVGLLKKLYTSD
jgi:hypothetical protein